MLHSAEGLLLSSFHSCNNCLPPRGKCVSMLEFVYCIISLKVQVYGAYYISFSHLIQSYIRNIVWCCCCVGYIYARNIYDIWIVQSERRRFNNRNLFTTLGIHLRIVCVPILYIHVKYHHIYYGLLHKYQLGRCVNV